MASKKNLILTKVINYVKSVNKNIPDEVYSFLPGLNMPLDESCTEQSSSLPHLRAVSAKLNFPILEPLKKAIDDIIAQKPKPKKDSNIDHMLKILEEQASSLTEPSTSGGSNKKRKMSAMKGIKIKQPKNEKKNECEVKKPKLDSDFLDADEFKLIYNSQSKWWKPFERQSNGVITPLCFCDKRCKKECNQWSKDLEVLCKGPLKNKCAFKMSSYAYLNFVEYLKEHNMKYFPIPKCNCSSEKKDQLTLRGSSEKANQINFWFFCSACRTTHNLDKYEKKIKSLMVNQPIELSATEPESDKEEESGDESDEDDQMEEEESSDEN